MAAKISYRLRQRPRGLAPLGAILAFPLLLLPFGGWLVECGLMTLARCTFKIVVGIPCMGCGGTRSTLNLLHGNFLEALYFSPMLVFAYAGLLVWGLLSLWLFLSDKELDLRMSPGLTWAVRIGLISVPFFNWFYLIALDI